MKHLYIKQNNNVEIVSSDIIEKLYQISQGGLYSTSDLIGNLQCTHAYDDAVTYLTTKFKNLQINVTDGKYIRFADKEVEKICATSWGGGTGITAAQAAAVSSVRTKFKNNTNIVSFNEFKYFTNCKTFSNSGESFVGCTNLKSIDLSNIILLSGVDGGHRGGFENCTSLNNVILNNHLEAIGFMAFDGCTSLENINIPNTVITIYTNAFRNCLQNIREFT